MPLSVLAASPSPAPEPIDPARVTPGVLGLLSLLFLVVAVFLLWRSMNKQLAKIEFEGSVPVDPEPATDPADVASEGDAVAADPGVEAGGTAPDAPRPSD